MSVAVVVGNPKPASRTLDAATRVANRLGDEPPKVVIDVIHLGAGLLGWGDPAVENAVAAVREATAVVVASPTYKASYTGLLKLFLDQIPTGGLAGVVGLPRLAEAVADASDAQLAAARQTVVALFQYLPLMIRMVGVMFGDDNYAGLAGLGQLDQQPEFG